VRWVWGIFLLAGAVFANCFVEAGKYYGVNPWLLYAIAKVESNLNPLAIEVISKKKLPIPCKVRKENGKYYYSCMPSTYEEAVSILETAISFGANYSVGLGQINRYWVKRFGISPYELFSSCYNIYWSAYILRTCLQKYGNSWKGVDCYNKGDRASNYSRYVFRVCKEIYGGRLCR